MVELFTAHDSIEARLVYNLLIQAGLRAHIDGEYLQGGAGELQAFGVVRVMVAEPDYKEARAILDDWENGGVEDSGDEEDGN